MSNRHQVRRNSGCRSREARGGREGKRDLSHVEHVEQVEGDELEGRVGVGEWRLDNHVDQVEHVEERGLGGVEEVGFGFGVGGGELGGGAREVEEISGRNLLAGQYFQVAFWGKRSDLFSHSISIFLRIFAKYFHFPLANT